MKMKFTIIVALACTTIYAQAAQIRIINEERLPVAGASVLVGHASANEALQTDENWFVQYSE
jgi:hypothetical protein